MGSKSDKDKSRTKMLKSPVIMASGISTNFYRKFLMNYVID